MCKVKFTLYKALRVEFLLKTNSEYPKDLKEKPPGIPFAKTYQHQFSSVQSHLLLSPIGARTLKVSVPYLPPSVGSYTRTPSQSCSAVGEQLTSLRSSDLVVPKLPACGCE